MVVSSLGCYEQRCYKHSCVCLLVNICIHFSQYMSRTGSDGSQDSCIFIFSRYPGGILSSISGLVITDMPILMAYVLVGCCTVLLGPALAILVVTHFHHHSLGSTMLRDGFKEVIGRRRWVRRALLGFGEPWRCNELGRYLGGSSCWPVSWGIERELRSAPSFLSWWQVKWNLRTQGKNTEGLDWRDRKDPVQHPSIPRWSCGRQTPLRVVSGLYPLFLKKTPGWMHGVE